MSEIIKPREGGSLNSGGISVQAAGQVNRINAEAKMQTAQLHQQYFNETIELRNSTLTNKKYLDAINMFQQRYQERLSTQFDADGNPTYGTLPQDIESISKEVQTEVLGTIKNNAVASLFENKFGSYTAQQVISSYSTARQQEMSFMKNQEQSNFQEFLRGSLLATSPEDIQFQISQYTDYLDSIKPYVGNEFVDNRFQEFRANLSSGLISRAIKADPFAAEQALIDNPNAFYIKDDIELEAALETADASKKEFRNLNKSNIELSLVENPNAFTVEQITAEVEAGKLTPIQGNQIKEKIIRGQNRVDSLKELVLDIDSDIESGRTLSEYSSTDIDKYYQHKTGVLEQRTGKRASLLERAGIATTIKAPVQSLQKEIKYILDDPSQDMQLKAQAVESYRVLMNNNPMALQGLDRDTQAFIASVNTLDKYSVMHGTERSIEAVQKARENMANGNDELVRAKLKQAKKINDILEFEKVLENKFDDFWFKSKVPVDANIVRAAQELSKLYFTKTLDEDAAIEAAFREISSVAGYSEAAGGKVVISPIENLYEEAGLSPAEFTEDLEASIAEFFPDLGLTANDVEIITDDNTTGNAIILNSDGTFDKNKIIQLKNTYLVKLKLDKDDPRSQLLNGAEYLQDPNGNYFRFAPEPDIVMRKSANLHGSESKAREGRQVGANREVTVGNNVIVGGAVGGVINKSKAKIKENIDKNKARNKQSPDEGKFVGGVLGDILDAFGDD